MTTLSYSAQLVTSLAALLIARRWLPRILICLAVLPIRVILSYRLVRCLQPPLNCKYVAGLWDYQVELQLLWSRICRGTRASTYKTPTWSWASSPGLLHYAPDALGDTRSELFKVLSIEVESSAGDDGSPGDKLIMAVFEFLES
jgi:hypothetical protein